MEKGYFCLVLHAHLPYVRHADRNDYLEERWVYEAMLESYVPLLIAFERMLADGVDYRITFSVSPTLLSMLADSLVQERFQSHLTKSIELALKEWQRNTDKSNERHLSLMYLERFREIAAYCSKYDYDLTVPLRRLQEQGRLELITSTATHAFIPYVETEEAIRAQIGVAMDTHQRILGCKPQGIWVPECGYTPGLDRLLAEAGLRYFFVEQHGIEHATPLPRRGIYAPLLTPYGVAAFARDPQSSKQVWSSEEGYPGDFDYREYYRDIGYDLDFEYIAPFIHPAGIRVNTGLKYHRITGKGDHKELYHPDWAIEKAATHAAHFLSEREKQIAALSSHMDRKPVIVAPYDAELFGHWWYEGPQFLEFFCRKVACDTDSFRMITPADYLAEYQDNDHGRLPMSTWGRNGYGEVWLNESNGWIYRHLHQAEREMIELAERIEKPSALQERALCQAARELMLSQSSDWAFMMDNKTTVEYGVGRTHDHLRYFFKLAKQIREDHIDEIELAMREEAYPIFPALDVSFFLPKRGHRVKVAQRQIAASADGGAAKPLLCVVIFSWEFPPHIVGGLAKAVYDLARHLVRQNVEVHVLTRHTHGSPDREVVDGIHVTRLHVFQPSEESHFLDWVFQFNLILIDELERLLEQGTAFNLVHAHDWLVGFAAMEAKRRFELPLAVTLHATEHGRNNGIHNHLQQQIHHVETDLMHEADQVIVCSNFMADRCPQIFSLSESRIERKMRVIPNGIEIPPPPSETDLCSLQEFRRQFALPEERIIFFVGRMVREKGVDLLLQAAPRLLQQHPQAKFIFAGKGPILEDIKSAASRSGIAQKCCFLGFVDDQTRDRLFQVADAAVFPSYYEPFGIVALEAMAYGTPLLVADTGGLSEIVSHGENGLKMYPGDVDSLVTELCWLLAHPDEAREMAAVAQRRLIDHYDWNQLASDTIEVYEALMADRLQPAFTT